MNDRIRTLILYLVCTFAATSVVAQESMQGLARPEWQLRADLEFRLTCQASLQKLCHDLIQTYQSAPEDPANTNLLVSVNALLETKDGKLPSKIPDHPATAEYAKERRAAFVEWSKVYKAKGRELPKLVLDAERKFQEQYQEADKDPANSPPQSTTASSGTGSSSSSLGISNSKTSKRNAGNSTGNAEKKLTEATISSMVGLIQEVDKYRSYTPVGDTTLEKNTAREKARESFYNFVEAQPDSYLTYTIVDVEGAGESLTFTVEEPLEFDAIRKQIGSQLRLSNHRKVITVKTSQTQKLILPIKPGDLLWVRLIFQFDGFGRPDYSNGNEFSVTHSGAIGDPLMKDGSSLFSKKTIVGFQVITKPAKAGPSK